MNSSRVINVADIQKKDEQCCSVADIIRAPQRATCPVSTTLSRKVPRRTVQQLLKSEKASSMRDAQYYYCADPNCAVVYFSCENVPLFTVDDVHVKVLSKDKGDDVNVCYCFNWTRARIKDEIAATGESTASRQIAKEVKAGNCSCDIKNPKGECCLGDVNSYVKSLA